MTDIYTVKDQLFFPESPRWHPTENALYFSDILDYKAYRLHPTGDIDLVITTEDLLSGLGWLPSGDMLIVLMNEQQIIRLKANDV